MTKLSFLANRDNRLNDVGYLTVESKKAIGVVGEVVLVDEEGVAVTSLGGGAGGGSIIYTNAAGDFTAVANDGTKTITITGLPFTLEPIHIVGGDMKKIDVNDEVSSVKLTDVQVTAGVITLADADDFVATDTIYMTLIGPDKWYDRDLDSGKQLTQNPEYGHYTDIEHIIEETNSATGMVEWEMESYKYFSLQLALTGGITATIWATNDSNADTDSDEDWLDKSDSVMGASSLVDSKDIFFVDMPTMPDRFMIKYVCADSSNAIDAHLRKY